MTPPRATLRLQFHKGFTLDQAAEHVPYYASLGISHLYASPLQTSRSGSTHGYDVVDPSRVNPELGGEDALRRLAVKLREHGMGLILDIVPNHMATGPENAWWQDVLKNGRRSAWARFFDIDWQSPDPALTGKVLAPFLGHPYGEALKNGSLKLVFDREEAAFFVEHYGTRFPVALPDYALILGGCSQAGCARLVSMFRAAEEDGHETGHAAAMHAAFAQALASDAVANGVAQAVEQYATDNPSGRGRLHHLLERQHYRLAWWRCAAEEINWRRFFEVSDLIGLRIERQEVFEKVHELPLRLYAEGIIDGVRVDHVDGLADPGAYCRYLVERLKALAPRRAALQLPEEPYVVVEKILADGEQLPADWPIHGTTGYDFMNDVGAVLHDESGEAVLTALWQNLARSSATVAEQIHSARGQMLSEHFVGEYEAAARALQRVARFSVDTRDESLSRIRRALSALLRHFPVYRLYVTREGASTQDENFLAIAVEGARADLHAGDLPTLELVQRWLGSESPCATSTDAECDLRMRAITRFQQLTPPLAAKALEDTVFYRYGRLLSRNEVGAEPRHLALSVDQFHLRCQMRQETHPHAMLATATHDHKRGEDARMRLAVVSGIPEEWRMAVENWRRRSRVLRGAEDDPALAEGVPPTAGEEVMLYQMLVAAWPPELDPADREGRLAFAERITAWQQKALREAKWMTGWMVPDTEYEQACHDLLWRILDLDDNTEPTGLAADIAAFSRRLAPAGIINSLAQTVLRLTCPGMPDLYQGTELWDFSLVDPDNRRPVDYALRSRLLDETMQQATPLPALLAHWQDGRIKQLLIRQLLHARATWLSLFSVGDYQPLAVEGVGARHVIAFARRSDTHYAIVVVTRLPVALLGDATLPCVPAAAWEDTVIVLPEWLEARLLTEHFSNRHLHVAAGRLPVSEALENLPVALVIQAIDDPA